MICLTTSLVVIEPISESLCGLRAALRQKLRKGQKPPIAAGWTEISI